MIKKKVVRKTKKIKPMRFRPSLFWDVDPKTIDPKKHSVYIIERVLDFGNDKEVRWLVHNYSPRLIKQVALESRVLHDKTRALWQSMF